MKEKTFKKWKQVLENRDFITERDLISIRNVINRAFATGNDEAVQYANKLLLIFEIKTFRLEQEHSEKGTNYILSKSLKKNGEYRKNNKITSAHEYILHGDGIKHVLIGLYNIGEGRATHFVPLYRVISDNGYFKYTGVAYPLMKFGPAHVTTEEVSKCV